MSSSEETPPEAVIGNPAGLIKSGCGFDIAAIHHPITADVRKDDSLRPRRGDTPSKCLGREIAVFFPSISGCIAIFGIDADHDFVGKIPVGPFHKLGIIDGGRAQDDLTDP